MKKYHFFILTLGLSYLFAAPKAYAVCQVVCPILVGGTLTLMEKYGIDNTISGLWIGGMLMVASLVTIELVARWKKHWSINIATFLLFYASSLIPLYTKHIIGNPAKEIWGMDKTLVGIIVGSIFFYLGDFAYEKIKARNGGHAWFPFQKTIMPIIPLAIFSLIFYFLTVNDIH